MKKIILPILFLLCISVTAFSQKKFEIGVEGAGTLDKYKINDPYHYLENVPCLSGQGGINFRVNDGRHIFYEIAVIHHSYQFGLKMKQEDGYSSGNSDEVLLIPLRFGYKIRLSKSVSIVPVLGIVPGFKTLVADADGETINPINSERLNYGYDNRESEDKNLLILAQGGLGIDFRVLKKIYFTFSGNYYQGLRKVNTYDVQYSINYAPVYHAEIYSKGSFLGFGLGIRYQL